MPHMAAGIERDDDARMETIGVSQAPPTTELTGAEHALVELAHEVRGPLTAIRGWLSMLQSGGVPTCRHPDTLRLLAKNAAQLETIVDEAADVARVRTGRVAITMTSVDLCELVAEVVESVQPAAASAGVRLRHIRSLLAVRVTADADRIAQIVRNLLLNSIKFTPQGGRVEAVTARLGAEARLLVSDTGIGIAASDLESIFEPYRQVDPVTRGRRGLGLGLCVARQIADLHGGRLVAMSAGPGRGSAFVVSLPGTRTPHESRPDRRADPVS